MHDGAVPDHTIFTNHTIRLNDDIVLYCTICTNNNISANKNIVASQPNVHLNKGNSVNEDLIPTESGVIPYALTQCRKTCIGRGYAYTIQQYKQIYANLSMFIVEPAFKAFDENSNTFNPYFYYTFQSSGNQHEVGPFMSGPNENVTVFNINGYPMVGQVYGQPKTLGLWAGSPELATPGSYAIGTEFCNETLYPLSTAITWINTTGYPPNDTRPPLQCVPGPGAYSGGGGVPPGPSDPTAPTDFDDYVTFTFCYENGVLVPCPPSPSPTSNPVLSPNALEPDSVAFIQIKDLNNPANSPIMIDVPSLYNDDGSFNGYNLNLAPSLYSFGFMFKHNGYWAKIGEFQNTTNLSLTQADMVNISVYPTPITNNRFEIETVGNATVQFVYELHDFSGELILNKDMSIRKDHEKVTSIEADNIPEGLLLHKFIFEDGSTQTIQTIKN